MRAAILLGCVAAAPAPPPVDVGGAVIKTWGFLRTTTDSLGVQAQDVLTAKQHLQDLEADVDTQRQAWQAAKEALLEENAELQEQIKQRQAPPPDYAGQSAALQLQINAAKAKVTATKLEADKTISVWQVKKQTYTGSINDLEHTQEEVQTKMGAQQDQALQQGQALEVKETELKKEMVSLKEQVAAQQFANETQTVEAGQNETSIQEATKVLLVQAEEVKADLAKVQATAAEAGALQAELQGGQQDLALAQEHKLQTTSTCEAATAELRSVLKAEKHKGDLVQAEALRCASLEANRDYLKKQVAGCAR